MGFYENQGLILTEVYIDIYLSWFFCIHNQYENDIICVGMIASNCMFLVLLHGSPLMWHIKHNLNVAYHGFIIKLVQKQQMLPNIIEYSY